MSLFENEQYRWRETYFVLFHEKNRPTLADVQQALTSLGDQYQIVEQRDDEGGLFESLTLISPDDFAAMDITYLAGEEVKEQVGDLSEEMEGAALSREEKQKLKRLKTCDARFDVYHFEQVVMGQVDEDEESYLDPGALLIVLERLARMCQGVGVDPQSGTLV
jgi:hypothetical protein